MSDSAGAQRGRWARDTHVPSRTGINLPSGLNLDGADLDGVDLDGADLDGADLLPYLKGGDATTPHDKLFWSNGSNRAVRSVQALTNTFLGANQQ